MTAAMASLPVLHVIGTDQWGRVREVYRCPNGIDQAVGYIAGCITHPEEDTAAAIDVVAEAWEDAVRDYAADTTHGSPYAYFSIDRRGYPLRYGLCVA